MDLSKIIRHDEVRKEPITVDSLRMKMKYISLVFLSLILGLSTTCSGINDGTSQSRHAAAPSPPAVVGRPEAQPSPSAQPAPDSPIRRIDFANFTFPKLPSKKCKAQSVTLHDGRYDAPEDRVPRKLPSVDCWSVALGSVTYGDVTGDAQEEAIVMLYAELGGTEGAQDVFVYGFDGGKPRLLWKFVTGDRADGGPRRVYAEHGELVVELFGVGAAIGKKLYGTEEGVGACCPKHFTRTRYSWAEGHFQEVGKQEVLPNPSESSAIVDPPATH